MAKLFDFESERIKDDLNILSDISLWLKYLYMDSSHSLKIKGYTVKMDSNLNLVYVMSSLQPDHTWKVDYDHSICANSLTYKNLIDITEDLRKDKKLWEQIKMSVSTCNVLNKS